MVKCTNILIDGEKYENIKMVRSPLSMIGIHIEVVTVPPKNLKYRNKWMVI